MSDRNSHENAGSNSPDLTPPGRSPDANHSHSCPKSKQSFSEPSLNTDASIPGIRNPPTSNAPSLGAPNSAPLDAGTSQTWQSSTSYYARSIPATHPDASQNTSSDDAKPGSDSDRSSSAAHPGQLAPTSGTTSHTPCAAHIPRSALDRRVLDPSTAPSNSINDGHDWHDSHDEKSGSPHTRTQTCAWHLPASHNNTGPPPVGRGGPGWRDTAVPSPLGVGTWDWTVATHTKSSTLPLNGTSSQGL
ncbi:hypothetical protein CONLIGDRAFT_685944 [Coniochaeta ligniaria NRRL 30616]|uniref:Uncharacterized protein n=1 Tax=Coniochaeta ligniaria NRRL 30616 TaxID=1408157 RepID=A0A1J7ITA0_9PEZI|nr:hypothetical protein CONLIGDRAFT_685944 [Coniochaeta ligniaria NRRL 30616]